MHVSILHHVHGGNPNLRLDHNVMMGIHSPNAADLAQYTHVWEGTIEPEALGVPANHEPLEFLEALWQHIEVGGPDCLVPRTIDQKNPIRSFMTGDVVVLEDQAYYCAMMGWEPVQP